MRVVVTGANGLLAAAAIREFETPPAEGVHEPQHEVVSLDRAALDITDAGAVARAIDAARPDVVINCAAYNDVDGAEDDPQTAIRINALGVLALAQAARTAGAVFVHYSTDFVFDGEASRPYREDDPPNPRSVYASSKLLGEWFALEHPSAYVLRVESLFGHPGPEGARQGSLQGILGRLRAREQTPVFIDRTVSPGYTADIAAATRQMIESRCAPGIYHCVNSGATSWAEIAAETARLLALPLQMKPITLDSVALRARRPKYSALSNAKLAAAGITMPSWQDALRRFLRSG